MKLVTKEILKRLKPFKTYEGKPHDEIPIAVKFFTPSSSWTWWVIEGEVQEDGDILFFGLVQGFEQEWGYFSLSELQSVRGPFGLPIERDKYFGDKTIADVEKPNA